MIPAPDDLHQKILSTVDEVHLSLQKSFVPWKPDDASTSDQPLECWSHRRVNSFLNTLRDVSRQRLGENLLAPFETKVAIVDGGFPQLAGCDATADVIVLGDKFLRGIEFATAHAALIQLLKEIRVRYDDSNNSAGLAAIIENHWQAVYGLCQSRLLLHLVGLEPAPELTSRLPARYREFAESQAALCTVFVLLHEQAHLTFAKAEPRNRKHRKVVRHVIVESLNVSKTEELEADRWAIEQVSDSHRATLLKAALFFFINSWILDYVAHGEESTHPTGANRCQELVACFPEFSEEDPDFFRIVESDLFGLSGFRRAMEKTSKAERRGAMMRFCWAADQFPHLEELVSALAQTYEELVDKDVEPSFPLGSFRQ